MHALVEPVAPNELHTVLHIHMGSGCRMIPVFRRNPDCHISALAYHNMVRSSAPVPFHHLFLTALVHPLSTCAYHLFLSHCNNYILPSDSRQPKLASCILYLPVGAPIPVFTLLLQPACFSMSSGWSISSHCATFAPTHLLLDVFRLELSFPFFLFYSNPLASRCLPVGAFLPIAPLFPNPLASRCLPVGAFLPIAPLFPNPLAAMHVLGGLSRKNRPALCGVARGC